MKNVPTKKEDIFFEVLLVFVNYLLGIFAPVTLAPDMLAFVKLVVVRVALTRIVLVRFPFVTRSTFNTIFF